MKEEKRGRTGGYRDGRSIFDIVAQQGEGIARAGDLLLLIGIGCPFFRFSSVAGSDFQCVISFFEGGRMALLAWFAWVVSFLLRIRIGEKVRTAPDLQTKFNKITGMYVASCLLTLLATVFMFVSSICLGNGSARPGAIDLDVGAYFFLLGASMALAGVSAFYDRLRDFVQDKISGI